MTISVAPQIRQYLLDLTAKGTFGNTIQEVARSLISSSIQDLIAQGAARGAPLARARRMGPSN